MRFREEEVEESAGEEDLRVLRGWVSILRTPRWNRNVRLGCNCSRKERWVGRGFGLRL